MRRMPEGQGLGASTESLCYVISEYPIVSHTFIEREVAGLRRAGLRVETVAMAPVPSHEILTEASASAAATTYYIRPVRLLDLIRSIAIPMVRHPVAAMGTLTSTLRSSPPGTRSHLWRLFYFVEALLLWSFCNRNGIRQIHAHHANVSSELARAAADFGNRIDEAGWSWSFTMHGCTELYDLIHYGLAGKVESADLVVAVSEYTRAQLLRIVDEDHWPKINVVHCGVDVEAFLPPDQAVVPSGHMIRPTSSASASDPLRLLFVGRLVVEKGLAVLLDTMQSLQANGDAVELTIVGDGPLRPRIESRIAEQALRVRCLGSIAQQEIVDLYQQHDVFVMTSFGEGLPVVLMEALACELPVVAPWISGIPELVEHEQTGLLVPAGRSDSLAAAIQRLSGDPDLRRQLGRNGRQRVLESFDADKESAMLAVLFSDLQRGKV
jgi:colanic acid/amylovoran biosynthesis glycosyltransferase